MSMYIICRKSLFWLILIISVSFLSYSYAENIDPYGNASQYAWAENVGWLNFQPSDGNGVHISATDVEGFVWAENIGWINLSPSTYAGVVNDGKGNLSGYAWAENVGWINFDPNVLGDPNDYGVTIDSDGNFSGWAWAENIGWINFNSADLFDYNINTCKVNFIDLANFADDWLQSTPGLPGDLSDNNDVDFIDYSIFASYWFDYCPDQWLLKQ